MEKRELRLHLGMKEIELAEQISVRRRGRGSSEGAVCGLIGLACNISNVDFEEASSQYEKRIDQTERQVAFRPGVLSEMHPPRATLWEKLNGGVCDTTRDLTKYLT